ncbi:RagB/SusD family nutrient uptake outer membrane protein [Fulvivirgaceae bacterium BMA10]|uniref:RagB/SusD family nutrient uptake outer membrane protein n=1 Tax=Splendidivirga corallicola TaxID=3051826 RepID=A0ABT8KP10_9BACT|nr:RagB/SusD family nutrient uptake outer membrane protein [Fulvivirgaceae bacterium BMA10]
MKDLKNILKVFFISFLILGCNDELLEKTDPGSGSVEAFFNNEDELVLGINGIYNAFQGSWWGGSLIHIQPHLDGATDNAAICCAWEYGFPAVATGNMSPTSGGIVAWKWTFGFQAVTRVNQMLGLIDDGIPGLEEANANKWRGELRFLRGFIYNEMATVYGDVPLITKVLTPEEASNVGRAPKNEVINAILADLTFAADNLETTPNRGDIGRPTKQAAMALKGKVQLYNDMFADAATTLGQVIAMEGGAVNLDSDYESLFNGSNEGSPEILFSIQALGDGNGEGSFFQVHYAPPNLPSGNTAGGWNSMHYTRNLLDDYYMSDGMSISESPLYDPDNAYANRDPRLTMSFLTPLPGTTWNGTVLEDDNFFFNGAAPDPVYAAQMILKKWSSEGTQNNGDTNVDFVLLRYADVLLMYAEAQNEAVGPDATVYSAVNKVRARVGMPDFPVGLSQAEMREEIRHERRIEFVMEGTRYYDLIRWRTAETVIPSIPNIENRNFDPSKNYLWPVPQSAVDSNPELIKQNPNY